jgi:uncharacterized protein with GYD domain
MPTYIMLSTLSPDGAATLLDKPERIKAVNSEVEHMGARILAQYAVLGQYDFVTILEADNDVALSRVAVELGSRGTLKTMTMSAIPVDDFIAGLRA